MPRELEEIGIYPRHVSYFISFHSFRPYVTSGSHCYKISNEKFEMCGRYQVSTFKMADPTGTRIVELKTTYKQTTHVVPDTRKHPEEAEKRAKPSVVPYHPGKCRKRPSRIKVLSVSGSLQELQNLLEDVRGTLSS